MTLIISTLTSSGIVLTADSRQTYKNSVGALRIGSDNAMKLFKITNTCGVAISGRAFLCENNQPPKDAGFFINRFTQQEKLEGLKIKEIAEKLNDYLKNIFVDDSIKALKKQIEIEIIAADGKELVFTDKQDHTIPYSFKDSTGKITTRTGWIDTINMIVAGIDDDKIGRAYSVSIPKGITLERDTQLCGAMWSGQTDVISRIIKGYDPSIASLNFVNEAVSKPGNDILKQLDHLEYIINWSTINIQDAIDFCVLMTKTTENIQRFSDGTILYPGGIAGVGGEVDIAVITPDKGFMWLKKKNLKADGAELSIN